ncbi:MAG: XcyI family restriction endonuclease, partial [Oscillospiraceae bacterium]|nr:XcyI family restriction endonuclease [Oscillospiraceae bacterium]
MINLPSPALQINFAFALKEVRERMLAEALQQCVEELDLTLLDSQLHEYADDISLKRVASLGLRGELLFAVPCILERRPSLLGYYRLLLGYSQKVFYTGESGVGKFKMMEEQDVISTRQNECLPELCKALCASATLLIQGLADYMLDREFLDDLTLLTLGPQLRGGANVQRGTAAIIQVFEVIQE